MNKLFVNIQKLIPSRVIHSRQASEGYYLHRETFMKPKTVQPNAQLQEIDDLFTSYSWLDWVSPRMEELKIPNRWVDNANEVSSTLEPRVKEFLQKHSIASLTFSCESLGQMLALRAKLFSSEVRRLEIL
jgi:hypothetical protein